MQPLSNWFDKDPRAQILNDGVPKADGACVFVWMQRTQRAHANPAINVAIEIAHAVNLPVIATFCLVPSFPAATLRPYCFMAEGLRELPDALATRKIGWVLDTGEPREVIPRLVRKYNAAAIVTDLNPRKIGREWRQHVAHELVIPMLTVDSDTVVPSSLFDQEEFAPRTLRPKIQRVLDEHLMQVRTFTPQLLRTFA